MSKSILPPRRCRSAPASGRVVRRAVLAAVCAGAITPAAAGAGNIVISQIYGNGGIGGGPATYANDFVELFNRTELPLNLTGWSLQYTSATGSSWSSQKVNLPSVIVPPGRFFLIQLGTSGGGGPALPTPDATASFNISATAGKVALVSNTTALTGTCPVGGGIVDFVGYGGSANCFEGGAAAPGTFDPTTSTRRLSVSQPCQDTDSNSTDFVANGIYPVTPRNSATAASLCPTGACCTGNGCSVATSALCGGGAYQGDGTGCSPDPCSVSIVDIGTLGGAITFGLAISADGRVVAGSSYDGSNQQRAVRWAGGVLDNLGTLTGGSDSKGWGINADGSVIVGESNISGGADRPFRWTAADGMEDIMGAGQARAYGVSWDGGLVVGQVLFPSGEALWWTRSTGTEPLPGLTGAGIELALDASADGLATIGYATNMGGSYRAAKWIGVAAPQDLGLCGGATQSFGYGANADGSVVVGYCDIGSNDAAFRWTSGGGMQSLGTLPGGTTSIAYDVNYDGSIVVGKAVVGGNNRAFIWTQSGGMQDLNTYAANQGVNLSGWTLTAARGISADGSAITGEADHGGQRGFYLRGLPGIERHWVGPAAGNWNSAANWASTQGGPGGAGVPTFGHNVFVEQGNPTVAFNTTYAAPGIQTLTLTGTINQSANTMFINDALNINGGNYNLTGGTLTAASVANNGSLTISNTAVLDIAGVISGNYVVYSGTSTMTGGTVTAPLGTSSNTTIIKTTPATLTFNGDLALNSNNTLQVLDGTVIFNKPYGSVSVAYLALDVEKGTVRIDLTGAPPRITKGSGVSVIPVTTQRGEEPTAQVVLEAGADEVMISTSLELDSGGRLDINDNAFVLDHSDSDGGVAAYALVRGYIKSGHGGGTWDGTGILSSEAAINPNNAVGVLNNDAGANGGTPGTPMFTNFQGATVDASSILVGYTLYGDSDLDTVVEVSDMNRWIEGYLDGLLTRGTPTKTGWFYGDYDYSDAIDMHDLYLLARAYYGVNGNITALQGAINSSSLSPAQKAAAHIELCRARGCKADFNNSCTVTVQDLFSYLSAWFAQSPAADFNENSTVTVQDLFDYLAAWFALCP